MTVKPAGGTGNASVADHMAALARSTGKVPIKVEPPKITPHGAVLFEIWTELHAQRASGFSGPEAISYQDIEARGRLLGERLLPWEVRAIRKLDDAYRIHVAETMPRPQ